MLPVVPPSVLAEAEAALEGAGLAGNEEEFFRMVRDWQPGAEFLARRAGG